MLKNIAVSCAAIALALIIGHWLSAGKDRIIEGPPKDSTSITYP